MGRHSEVEDMTPEEVEAAEVLGNLLTPDWYGEDNLDNFFWSMVPDPQDIRHALWKRIHDARKYYLTELQFPIPDNFHIAVAEAVQGVTHVFDPTKPLLDWLNETAHSVSVLRRAMVPMPATNQDILNLTEDEFIAAMTPALASISGFPDARMMLDPFFMNNIYVGIAVLNVGDMQTFPTDVLNDTGFFVNMRNAESLEWLGQKRFTNWGFISFLLYYTFVQRL